MSKVAVCISEDVQKYVSFSEIMDLAEKYKPKSMTFNFVDCDYIIAQFEDQITANKFELELYKKFQ